MLPTRIRPACGALLAACLLLPNVGRPADEKGKTPPAVTDREQLRKELEAQLAGRPADEVRAFVERLASEWPARKGAHEVAHARFTAQSAELGKARQRLDELKAPAAP